MGGLESSALARLKKTQKKVSSKTQASLAALREIILHHRDFRAMYGGLGSVIFVACGGSRAVAQGLSSAYPSPVFLFLFSFFDSRLPVRPGALHRANQTVFLLTGSRFCDWHCLSPVLKTL